MYFDLVCQEEQAIFSIKDKGIGIPKDEQEQVFDSFYRASNTGTIAGTGVGLAIAKKCVELHQGQIIVDSEVGVGTTFTVKLPLNLRQT
jgi:signal transduction histidine kinase